MFEGMSPRVLALGVVVGVFLAVAVLLGCGAP
jgi:hypothetical protein